MKKIVWDWNGTLLDDVEISFSSMNTLLRAHSLKEIESIDNYRDIFCFPVQEYYKKAGFDFNVTPFESLAMSYMEIYNTSCERCELSQNSKETLERIKQLNFDQIILSASHKKNLIKQVKYYNIENYFSDILGVENIYAKSKVELGKRWVSENNIKPENVVLIGDTDHDYEVANELSFNFIHCTCGHQNVRQLKDKNIKRISNLKDVLEVIEKFV